MLLHVESLSDAQVDVMSLARMRELFAEVVARSIPETIEGPDGEKVPVSLEELKQVEVLEQNNGRAVGVRPLYELYYKECRFPQEGTLKGTPAQFVSSVRYAIGVALKELSRYQPGFRWQMVGALVDPVNLARTVVDSIGYEPTPEEVGIRMGAVALELKPKGKLVEDPARVSNLVRGTREVTDWVWYLRTAWAANSGGDFEATVKTQVRYAESRQLRHMPGGTKRNRDKALDLLDRLGQRRLQVAPASRLSPGQRLAAKEMLEAGSNVALVAQAMGLTPEDLLSELPVPDRAGNDETKAKGRGRAA